MKKVLLIPLCAALSFSMPAPETVSKVLPYMQMTAALAVLTNNTLQVVILCK